MFVIEKIINLMPMAVLIFQGERGIITGIKQYGMVDVLGHINSFLDTPAVINAVGDIKSIWDVCKSHVKIAVIAVNSVHGDKVGRKSDRRYTWCRHYGWCGAEEHEKKSTDDSFGFHRVLSSLTFYFFGKKVVL